MKLFIPLTALLILLIAASLLIGPAGIGLKDSLASLFIGDGTAEVLVMREIRLPRTLLAALIGGGLGLCGAALQGWLRNPLVEPGILGTSSGAALGAVIALQTGFASLALPLLPLSALMGAFLAVVLLLAFAGRSHASLTLILAGVAISSLAGAGTSLALNLSPNPYAAYETMFWTMGSVADRSLFHLALAAPLVLLGCAVLLTTCSALKALTLGEDTAASLGFNLSKLRLQMILGSALIVGGATAVAGAIGFVGLVVPHLLRPLVKHNPAKLLPVSFLGGAILLLAADITIRLIAPERDLKLGVLTALLGAPLFLHLVWRQKRGAY